MRFVQSKVIYFFIYSLVFIVSCAPLPKVEEKKPEIKVPPSKAKEYYSYGYEYLKNRMYDEAIKNFNQAIQESTLYVDAYLNLGLAHKGKREYGEVEGVYRKLEEVSPLDAHYALGSLCTEMRRYEAAISEYKKALEIDTAYTDAIYGMGYTYEKLGNLEEAIKHYKKALKFEPENESVRYSLGKSYIAQGDYEKGLKELRKLATAHPEDLDVRGAIGQALIAIKNYKDAKIEFEYIVQHSPTNIADRINLGAACEGLKEYKIAIQKYEEAISLDTTNILPYCHLINLYIRLKNLSQARKYLHIARGIDSKNQVMYCLAGDIQVEHAISLFKKKKYEASISAYKSAVNEYNLALQGESPEWIKYAKKALERVRIKLKEAKEEKWWH